MGRADVSKLGFKFEYSAKNFFDFRTQFGRHIQYVNQLRLTQLNAYGPAQDKDTETLSG